MYTFTFPEGHGTATIPSNNTSSTLNINLCMNPNAFTRQIDLADEEEEDEMDWELTATAVAAIVVGVLVARQQREERQLKCQLYLMRAQLLPDPRRDTPWQVLYASKSDCTETLTMGLAEN
jgi:hypothetical protein